MIKWFKTRWRNLKLRWWAWKIARVGRELDKASKRMGEVAAMWRQYAGDGMTPGGLRVVEDQCEECGGECADDIEEAVLVDGEPVDESRVVN